MLERMRKKYGTTLRATAAAASLLNTVPEPAQAQHSSSWASQIESSSRKLPKAEIADPKFMLTYREAVPPEGFQNFCLAFPKECVARDVSVKERSRRISITPQVFKEIEDINTWVNAHIQPITDLAHFGIKERWSIPTTHGDCEDFALLKRKLLIARGYPPESLLITIVSNFAEGGEGHAVLTARTSEGDFVLDNIRDGVHLWNTLTSAYGFMMRQASVAGNQVWLALDPRYAAASQDTTPTK